MTEMTELTEEESKRIAARVAHRRQIIPYTADPQLAPLIDSVLKTIAARYGITRQRAMTKLCKMIYAARDRELVLLGSIALLKKPNAPGMDAPGHSDENAMVMLSGTSGLRE
jgi:hypothetical protein